MLLRYIYTVFLSILLAIFIGMGVSVFYPSPKSPEYPPSLQYADGADRSATEKRDQKKYDEASKAYSEKSQDYNRNVSIIVLVCSIILLTLGLVLGTNLHILADSLLLGGVFTLVYSLGRAFASSNSKYSFSAVSISLLITVVLGYIKFIKPHQKSTTK